MNPINKILLLFIVFLLNACTSYKVQYANNETKNDSIKQSNSTNNQENLVTSFYLIGDAGDAKQNESTEALIALKKLINQDNTTNDYTLFLGDNIYEKGLPSQDDKTRQLSEHRLDKQIEAIQDFNGRVLFIPGNHDWYTYGVKGLKRQEKYIEKALNDKDAFQPENGCPIEKIKVSDEIALVIIDSQWYLEDWDKHPTINDDCDIKTRHDFFVELKSIFSKSNEKTLLVALHHPMYTNGYHGGHFNANKHLFPAKSKVPIPVLGSLAVQMRSVGGVSVQDISNSINLELMKRIRTMAQGNDRVIFVSGHEHNLQYIHDDGIHQIVSGAGSKGTPVSLGSNGLFSYGKQGFAKLDLYKDGTAIVKFFSATNGEPELLYTKTIFEPQEEFDTSQLESQFTNEITTSVYPKELTQKSNFFTWIWGEHYRNIYGTDIQVPVATLDTLYGGMQLLRRGGGFQTRSVKVKTTDGKIFVIRAAKKSALQFIQAAAFANVYVKDDLKNTYSEKLALDLFTAGHPFANLTIPILSDAIGLYHTNPELIYIPKHPYIKDFNKDHANELYVIEEHPDDTFLDLDSFGNPDAIESTSDVLANILKDEKYQVDEQAHIRARIFDMLIGDWDRHSDQWKWSRFNVSDDKVVYRPIPRDRDQAFSNFDGNLFNLLKFIIPDVRKFQEYGKNKTNIHWLTISGVKLDRAILQQSYKEDWLAEAMYVQQHITDDVIEDAFSKLPEGVQNETAREIKEKLKERRKNIVHLTNSYYDHFIKLVVITATHKDDYIEVFRNDFTTTVAVSRIKKGVKEAPYKERIIKSEETDEIWVYALDDEDYIKVHGKGKKPIYTRIVGGQNNDSFEVKNGKKVKIYDYKSKPNTVVEKGTAVIKFQDIYDNNVYDYTRHISKVNAIVPFFGFNPDDGFQIKLKDTYTIKGFKNNPYYRKFALDAGYYFATQSFDIRFESYFTKTIGKWDFRTALHITNNNYTMNFFGFGNETKNLGDDLGMDYNRVRTGNLSGTIGVLKKGFNGSNLGINFSVEQVEVEPTEGRFITEFYDDMPEYFNQDFSYLHLHVNYDYESYDVPANPKKGMKFNIKTGIRSHINNFEETYAYLRPNIEFYNPLTKNKRLVLNTKVQGQFNIGNDFEFFQASRLGAASGLRGYRKQRFQGKSALAFGGDLRYSFTKIRTQVFPIQIGIFGGYDIGRVWVKNENSKVWHDDLGGGFWLNILDSIAAEIGVFASDERTQITFGLGIDF